MSFHDFTIICFDLPAGKLLCMHTGNTIVCTSAGTKARIPGYYRCIWTSSSLTYMYQCGIRVHMNYYDTVTLILNFVVISVFAMYVYSTWTICQGNCRFYTHIYLWVFLWTHELWRFWDSYSEFEKPYLCFLFNISDCHIYNSNIYISFNREKHRLAFLHGIRT